MSIYGTMSHYTRQVYTRVIIEYEYIFAEKYFTLRTPFINNRLFDKVADTTIIYKADDAPIFLYYIFPELGDVNIWGGISMVLKQNSEILALLTATSLALTHKITPAGFFGTFVNLQDTLKIELFDTDENEIDKKLAAADQSIFSRAGRTPFLVEFWTLQ